MSENDPALFMHFRMNVMTEEGAMPLDCTPDNTELYLHGDAFKDVDHIFHRLSEEQGGNAERTLGGFAWRHALGDELFNQISSAMIQSANWVCHYRPVPMEDDMMKFASEQLDVPDELPEDFS